MRNIEHVLDRHGGASSSSRTANSSNSTIENPPIRTQSSQSHVRGSGFQDGAASASRQDEQNASSSELLLPGWRSQQSYDSQGPSPAGEETPVSTEQIKCESMLTEDTTADFMLEYTENLLQNAISNKESTDETTGEVDVECRCYSCRLVLKINLD